MSKRLYIVEWREGKPHRGREFYVFTNKKHAVRNMHDELALGDRTMLYEIELPEPFMELEMTDA